MRRPNAILLVVAHTDSGGAPAVNHPLSVDRAETTRAFLQGDADTWLKFYDSPVPFGQRWGATEDGIMLNAVPTRDRREKDEDPIHWFQRTRGLEQTGTLSRADRKVLIEEYMAVPGDGFAVPPQVRVEVVGAGESYPEAGLMAAQLRRADVLLFPRTGVTPPVPSPILQPNAGEYQRWLQGAERYPCGSMIRSTSPRGTGKIIVRVQRRDGSGVKSATVGIVLGPSRPLNLTTDPDGNVMFENLAAGRYIVGASLGPRFIGQRVVEALKDGATERRVITLVEDTTSLQVSVYLHRSEAEIREMEQQLRDLQRQLKKRREVEDAAKARVASIENVLDVMRTQSTLTPTADDLPGQKIARTIQMAQKEQELREAQRVWALRRAQARETEQQVRQATYRKKEADGSRVRLAYNTDVELMGPSPRRGHSRDGVIMFHRIKPGRYTAQAFTQDSGLGYHGHATVTVEPMSNERLSIHIHK